METVQEQFYESIDSFFDTTNNANSCAKLHRSLLAKVLQEIRSGYIGIDDTIRENDIEICKLM